MSIAARNKLATPALYNLPSDYLKTDKHSSHSIYFQNLYLILFLFFIIDRTLGKPLQDEEEDRRRHGNRRRRPCRGRDAGDAYGDGKTFVDWNVHYTNVNYNYNVNCGGLGGLGGNGLLGGGNVQHGGGLGQHGGGHGQHGSGLFGGGGHGQQGGGLLGGGGHGQHGGGLFGGGGHGQHGGGLLGGGGHFGSGSGLFGGGHGNQGGGGNNPGLNDQQPSYPLLNQLTGQVGNLFGSGGPISNALEGLGNGGNFGGIQNNPIGGGTGSNQGLGFFGQNGLFDFASGWFKPQRPPPVYNEPVTRPPIIVTPSNDIVHDVPHDPITDERPVQEQTDDNVPGGNQYWKPGQYVGGYNQGINGYYQNLSNFKPNKVIHKINREINKIARTFYDLFTRR